MERMGGRGVVCGEKGTKIEKSTSRDGKKSAMQKEEKGDGTDGKDVENVKTVMQTAAAALSHLQQSAAVSSPPQCITVHHSGLDQSFWRSSSPVALC